ncbi:MAG: histidine phosphatase family protein [Candidatus Latescibacteria bacterium]|nr:histidine phosphatase family protein [Candidatus Latescibacterota bacterium]
MPNLILVKHSLPHIDETAPAKEWLLGAEGRRRAQVLAQKMARYQPDLLISSLEPKAQETAQIVATALGKPLETVANLHEHDRSQVGFLAKDQFAAAVTRFFAQPDELVFGAETAHAAKDRFSQAIYGILARFADDNIAVVCHGTVISLFAAQVAQVDPHALWRQLGLPSWIVLSRPDLNLVETVVDIDDKNGDTP